ncbi:MFS transporter [Marivivens marinus]|uniref:MFS transporter n=1 Tax=Marivivens marinus TaxID=3110173 RepID=UPI003B846D76
MDTFRFIRENAPWLAAGALLSFLSSFGQTFFISIFAGEIRDSFGLSHGQWGGIYTLGTTASAIAMVFAGGLADRFRVRVVGIFVLLFFALACLSMALNWSALLLPVVIFALRFGGQGMSTHLSMVAMARWFVATRGRALAIASMGFALGEATLPVTIVWLKEYFDWRLIWTGAAIFLVVVIPVLLLLLRTERTPAADIEANSAPGMDNRHWTRKEALTSPLFFALVPALIFFPAFGTAFWFQQVHFAEIKGWDHLSLVAVFPLGTLTLTFSTVLYGFGIDRFGAVRLLPIYLLPLIVAFTLHALTATVFWTAIGVILMGLAGGGQATLLSACWAELFGTRNLGSIKAGIAAVMVFGSAIGPGLSGWMIDLGIGFERQLLGYAACFALAGIAMVHPVRSARRRLSPAT